MPNLDVEALLDSTARSATSNFRAGSKTPSHTDENYRNEKQDRHGRTKDRESVGNDQENENRRRRSRSADRRSEKTIDNEENTGSRSSRRRSRSRSPINDRRTSGRDRDRRRERDRYRERRRRRSRSRSPNDDRHYRPSGRSRKEHDRDRGGRRGRRRSPSGGRSLTPPPSDADRDRRTIFVQQLAVHLRTKELIEFFEKAGPVKEAQIVKDRVSNRSKGVGYVEFKTHESVALALQLTGQRLLGIPVIVQHTEAEKNSQAKKAESQSTQRSSGQNGFHRLYVGNIHFNITENDLRSVFEAFGELEFVQLQKEESGRSKGYGFVQFAEPEAAKEALDKMNGFNLAGRPIRVGLGNDKGNTSNTANRNAIPGSASSITSSTAHSQTGSGPSTFDRIGSRDNTAAAGGASALDDSDVVGVNFNASSRDALMRKLARVDSNAGSGDTAKGGSENVPPLPIDVPQASRCVVVKNMFNIADETGTEWIKELELDIREECESKYGEVIAVIVDASTDGDVYIKFRTVDGGEKAINGLTGRYFAGRRIVAQPVVDAVYSVLSRARAG